MKDKKMEPGFCPKCGSHTLSWGRMDKGVKIMLWQQCNDCGCVFIERYGLEDKGIVEEGDE